MPIMARDKGQRKNIKPSWNSRSHSWLDARQVVSIQFWDMNGTDKDGYAKSSLFYDTVVLDSPIRENESLLKESCFHTQVVDDDHSDDGIGHVEPSELDNEIVLDSEEEGSYRITSRSENISSRKSEGRIPCLHVADSIDKQLVVVNNFLLFDLKRKDGLRHVLIPVIEGDHEIGRLEYVNYRESEELSRATALCFVDNFLSFNIVDMCQGIEERTRIKSPLVSSSKGTQHLGSRRLSNKHEEELTRLHNDMKGSSHSLSVFKDQCSEVSTGIEKESEGNYIHGSFKEFDEVMPTKSSSEIFEVSITARDVPNLFDVGIGTQIASEVMKALYYGLPPSCNTGDTCEGLENTFTDLQEGETQSRTSLESNSLPKVAACETGEVAKEPIPRKRSAMRYNKEISSSSWNYDNQMLGHKIEPNGYKCKQSKVDESVSNKNLKKCKNYVNQSIPDEHTLLRKQPSHEEPVIHRSRQMASGVTVKKTNDLVDKPRRKRKRVVANPPPKLLSGKHKFSKLHSYASTEASDGKPSEQQQSSLEEDAIARLLRLEVPIYSRGESNMHESLTSVGAEEQNMDSVRSKKLPEDGETNSCNFNLKRQMRTNLSQFPLENNSDESLSRNICNVQVAGDGTNSDLAVANISARDLDRAKAAETAKLHYVDSTSSTNSLKNHNFGESPRNSIESSVLFNQHLDDDVIKQHKKIYAQLGISITSCSTDATHFIANKFVRTKNMLEAIVVGKPVVTPLWLDSFGQTSCLLNEKKYILRDAKKEKEIGFIFITQNVKPNKEIITSLVKAVGGEVCVPTSVEQANMIKMGPMKQKGLA
ncbi:hypothetical protein GQ457_15G023010 [Hibiscus cannabinus]